MNYSSSSSTPSSQRRFVKFQCLVLGAAGAGKTSILRRYFYKTFESSRRPTLGSDLFTGRVPHPSDDGSVEVRLQMWDTPGRERFELKRHQHSQYTTASLSDNFFRQADAVMLVYDMTSSTSFISSLKWYADLMELATRQRRGKPLPVFIVANKLDMYLAKNQRGSPHLPKRVEQRDVLGLEGNFTGKDFRYEYRVSPIEQPNASATASSSSSVANRRRRRHDPQTFLANRENWTSDGSYLDSLLTSEDGSHPDREMVLLWCLRNGLKHVEVSAATGENVDAAMDALVQLALDAQQREQELDKGASSNTTTTPTQRTTQPPNVAMPVRRHEKLDLHKRYAPEQDTCIFLRSVIQWFKRIGH